MPKTVHPTDFLVDLLFVGFLIFSQCTPVSRAILLTQPISSYKNMECTFIPLF